MFPQRLAWGGSWAEKEFITVLGNVNIEFFPCAVSKVYLIMTRRRDCLVCLSFVKTQGRRSRVVYKTTKGCQILQEGA